MNEILAKEEIKIESMICKIREKKVMLDSGILSTKYHCCLYDKKITYYDIGKPSSMFNNFIMGGKII